MKKYVPVLVIFAALAGCTETEPAVDQKPVEVTPNVSTPDLEARKVLAESCSGCHGEAGRQDVPYIAGQSVEYLTSALTYYKDGSRGDETMKLVKAPLSEQDIINVSAYYASLPADWGEKGSAGPGDERGEATVVSERQVGALAASCAACHGEDGNTTVAGIPSLAGLSVQYLVKATKAYREGTRSDMVMAGIVSSLDDTAVTTLAEFYAGQSVRKSPVESSGDAKAGETVSAACTGCHGANGNSVNQAIPSLTGQNGEYLAKATTAYQKGDRPVPMMTGAVAALTDSDIQNLAAFFASQEPVRSIVKKDPADSLASKPAAVDPVAEGRTAAATCAACHGETGNSQTPGMPNLTGQHPDYLKAAVDAYRKGQRPDAAMSGLAASLTDADLENIALFYAVQDPVPTVNPALGDAAAGKTLSASCGACHGPEGISPSTDAPSLAGQDPQYLVKSVQAYAVGERPHGPMKGAVEGFSDDAIANLAAFYAGLQPKAPKVRLPMMPEQWAAKCDRCHGTDGYSSDARFPRIAGQREAYFASALDAYQKDVRSSSMMHAMSSPLSAVEIKSLAAYYSQR